MMYRMFPLAALAAALCFGALTLAANDAEKSTHDGKVVSIAGDQLVMTGTDGKEHSHTVAADAKVTCDGRDCKSADLKAGMRIRVTATTVTEEEVTGIESLEKYKKFASMHEGTVVSIVGKKLVMKSKDGKEHAHTLAADAAVCCDGKACKAAELKAGMRIRVTTQEDDQHVATRIEALGKQKNFAETHEGTMASIAGDTLVMKSKDGKEHDHTLAADATVTCDGKVCKVADLKPETRIRVTISRRLHQVVTGIEALDKQSAFAAIK